MTKRILAFTPTDDCDVTVTAYGHVFAAGTPLDLGEDEAAYERLKANPEFSLDGKAKKPRTKTETEPAIATDPASDESNDGKDARTRAATQAQALKTAKAETFKAETGKAETGKAETGKASA